MSEIDLLAKEIVKGHPLIACLKASLSLDSLLQYREENISILYAVADKLDEHTRKSSIAKFVGSVVGTNGKIATGIGLAALVGAPFTGGISLFAGGALLTGGGAAAALGTATSGLTYATEYYLCKQQLIKANNFIKADKKNSEKYNCDIEDLKIFCSQYDNKNTLEIILTMFTKFKKFVKDTDIDFKGMAEMLGVKKEDIGTAIRQQIKSISTNSTFLATTAVKLFSSNPVVFLAGGGASVLFLDVFVLFKNTYNLATNEGHPTAIELRNYAKELEKETEKLKDFSKCFKHQIHDIPEVKSGGKKRTYQGGQKMTKNKSMTYQSKYHDDIPNVVTALCQNKNECDDETELLSECSSIEHESAVKDLHWLEYKRILIIFVCTLVGFVICIFILRYLSM